MSDSLDPDGPEGVAAAFRAYFDLVDQEDAVPDALVEARLAEVVAASVLPEESWQFVKYELENFSIADPRLTVVQDDGEFAGFDVATPGGVAEVRLRQMTEFNVHDPQTWQAWIIRSGPNVLAGTRYDSAGRAIRAALRGWVWPHGEGWDPEFERELYRWSEPPGSGKGVSG